MNTKFRSLLSTILIMTMIAGCTAGSYSAQLSSDLSSAKRFAMSYSHLNGWKSRKITTEDNETTLELSIQTVAGVITTTVINSDAGVELCRKRLSDAQSFTTKLEPHTRYELRVGASDHSGSYSFSWGRT